MRVLPALTVMRVHMPSFWDRLLLAIEASASSKQSWSAASPSAATWQGRIEDFEPFFRQHEHEIFTYLWRMTGDEHAAYDLAQETFLRAWQHFARIRDYERPGGWLFRVATHLALNHLRDQSVRRGASIIPVSNRSRQHTVERPEGRTDDLAMQIANADLVRRALMALTPRHRAALVLREVYGFPCGQVAAILGMSVGSIKTLLWRARDEFRGRYAEEDR